MTTTFSDKALDDLKENAAFLGEIARSFPGTHIGDLAAEASVAILAYVNEFLRIRYMVSGSETVKN
jgi:hypothetical protein